MLIVFASRPLDDATEVIKLTVRLERFRRRVEEPWRANDECKALGARESDVEPVLVEDE